MRLNTKTSFTSKPQPVNNMHFAQIVYQRRPDEKKYSAVDIVQLSKPKGILKKGIKNNSSEINKKVTWADNQGRLLDAIKIYIPEEKSPESTSSATCYNLSNRSKLLLGTAAVVTLNVGLCVMFGVSLGKLLNGHTPSAP